MNSYEVLLRDTRYGRIVVNAESEDEAQVVASQTPDMIQWDNPYLDMMEVAEVNEV